MQSVEYTLQAAFSRLVGAEQRTPLNKLEWEDVYQGPKNAAVVTTLRRGSEYALRVRASNAAGAGPFSGLGKTVSVPVEPAAPHSVRYRPPSCAPPLSSPHADCALPSIPSPRVAHG